MTNPYDSQQQRAPEFATVPTWYAWFGQLYWPAWLIGSGLVFASWFDLVSPKIGWIGFWVAGVAALASYILPSFVGAKSEEFVILDSRLLSTRGDKYIEVIDRFRTGATLRYDGVGFTLRSDETVSSRIVADEYDMDDRAALALADHAEIVFEKLKSESVDFRSAVVGRQNQISIMSGVDAFARELCRVVDGKLEWRR